MKKLQNSGAIFTLIVLLVSGIGCAELKSPEKQRTLSFDQDWLFIKEDPAGAEKPDFDDSQWRILDVPHDWSIEDLPGQVKDSVVGPHLKSSPGKMGTGYTVGGTAWYRKHFTIDKSDQGKLAYLQFDGIYMNADVWINGKHLGNHPYGYTSFWYDISPFLNPAGQSNVLAVQVKNEGRNARWYSGSGIYRHTWLTLVNPVHIQPWGVYVTTPEVSEEKAKLEVQTSFINSGSEEVPVTCLVRILDPSGTEVGNSSKEIKIGPGKSLELNQVVQVDNPELWSGDDPNLYHAEVVLLVEQKTEDKLSTPFGIRTLHFDAQQGFLLNGKNILLRGGNIHHDNGPLGSAAIDRAVERKIEILKDAGFNAIRCSHNPPSPYLLDVCDRLGILVINESFDMWEIPKMGGAGAAFFGLDPNSTKEYSMYFRDWWQKDMQSMMLRDRNHPSVIMWSIGNEILEAADSSGMRIAGELVDEVKKYDSYRPVTEAFTSFDSFFDPGMGDEWDRMAPHIDKMDVAGYNYNFQKYERDHINYPARIMYASESHPPQSFIDWQKAETLPYVIGNFSWTAMDHLGESGIGIPRLVDIATDGGQAAYLANTKQMFSNMGVELEGIMLEQLAQILMFFNQDSWPMFINYSGDIDLIGNPKIPYYYQNVVWRNHMVSMFVHQPLPSGKEEITSPWGYPDLIKSWNWEGHEGENMQVLVYTRSPLVRLELNGKVVGEQKVDENQSITATFEVPYEPGTLTVSCIKDGTETASETISTVGKPAAIRLSADRATIKADRNDLSYVMVEIIDAEGNVIPNADDILVDFEISGPGEIAGVGSGSPTDMSSFQQPRKKSWQGKCLAIVRPKGPAGEILLTARAEGLQEANIDIVSQ